MSTKLISADPKKKKNFLVWGIKIVIKSVLKLMFGNDSLSNAQ